jgi:hypothetical protein
MKIILSQLLIFTLFLSGYSVSEIIAQESTEYKLSYLGEFERDNFANSLSKATLKEDVDEIVRASHAAFMKTMFGGDNSVSYSTNGEFKAEKVRRLEHSEHDFYGGAVLTVIKNKYGNQLWQGKAMVNQLISNNGRNFVASDLSSERLDIHFHDFNSPKPIKSYIDFSFTRWKFSEDGNHLVVWDSRRMTMFSSEGDIMWTKKVYGISTGEVAISPDGIKVAITNSLDKRENNSNSKPVAMDNKKTEMRRILKDFRKLAAYSKSEALKDIEYYNRKGKEELVDSMRAILKDAEQPQNKSAKRRYIKPSALTLNPDEITLTFSIITNELDEKIVTFRSKSLGVKAISFWGTDCEFVTLLAGSSSYTFSTKGGSLLWKIENEERDPVDLTISNDGKLIALFYKKYEKPITQKSYFKPTIVCILLSNTGKKLYEINFPGQFKSRWTFSENNMYIVTANKKIQVVKID